MSITDAKSAQGGETLAKRFADYLNDIDNPADIAVLVRSFELSPSPQNVTEDDQEEFGHRINGGIPLGAAYLIGHHDH
jgi:hypothetical protein